MNEERVPYHLPIDDRWVFVRNREGRATNVRVQRGTTIIEVLHRGERVLVDVAEMAAIDLPAKCSHNG